MKVTGYKAPQYLRSLRFSQLYLRKIKFFWGVTPCWLVTRSRRFRAPYCLGPVLTCLTLRTREERCFETSRAVYLSTLRKVLENLIFSSVHNIIPSPFRVLPVSPVRIFTWSLCSQRLWMHGAYFCTGNRKLVTKLQRASTEINLLVTPFWMQFWLHQFSTLSLRILLTRREHVLVRYNSNYSD